MDLPAQAIRCSLDGVFRPKNPDGSHRFVYPEETFDFMCRFRRMPAIAFFSEWLVGQVGHISGKPSFEFMAQVIL